MTTEETWVDVRGGEYSPPDKETVWTTDGAGVRKATWVLGDPLTFGAQGWPVGNWLAPSGEILTVTHWQFVEDDSEAPPPALGS